MGDLLDGYTPERAWDEMFAAPDEPRSHCAALHQVLATLYGGPSRSLDVAVELTRVA